MAWKIVKTSWMERIGRFISSNNVDDDGRARSDKGKDIMMFFTIVLVFFSFWYMHCSSWLFLSSYLLDLWLSLKSSSIFSICMWTQGRLLCFTLNSIINVTVTTWRTEGRTIDNYVWNPYCQSIWNESTCSGQRTITTRHITATFPLIDYDTNLTPRKRENTRNGISIFQTLTSSRDSNSTQSIRFFRTTPSKILPSVTTTKKQQASKLKHQQQQWRQGMHGRPPFYPNNNH